MTFQPAASFLLHCPRGSFPARPRQPSTGERIPCIEAHAMAEIPIDSRQTMRVAATRRHRRRWTILGLIVAVIVVTVVLILPGALAPIVERKLEALVANHLHARIEIGSLAYRFPYGVSVHDAKFVTDESHDGVQLLTVRSLDLSLAELPLGSGPIVIRSFTVVDPVVHLVR